MNRKLMVRDASPPRKRRWWKLAVAAAGAIAAAWIATYWAVAIVTLD